MTITAATAKIAASARRMGLIVTTDLSERSDSRYLEVSTGDDVWLKIRVSDHELPPYYEGAEIDASGVDCDWLWAIECIASRLDRPVCPYARRERVRRDRIAAAKAAVDAAATQAHKAHATAVAASPEAQRLLAEIAAVVQGKRGKNRRATLRRQIDAALAAGR